MHRKGFLIAFEGIDGSGKSTAAKNISEYLVEQHIDTSLIEIRRMPEDAIPWQIKRITQDAKNCNMSRRTETLLYLASLAERTSEYVIPSLDRGEVVLADRFAMSIVVLGIHARNQPSESVLSMTDFATLGISPDLTILFDVDPTVALARKSQPGKPLSRKESEGQDLFDKLRFGYLVEAKRLGSGCVVLRSDALSLDDMLTEARQAIKQRLPERYVLDRKQV